MGWAQLRAMGCLGELLHCASAAPGVLLCVPEPSLSWGSSSSCAQATGEVLIAEKVGKDLRQVLICCLLLHGQENFLHSQQPSCKGWNREEAAQLGLLHLSRGDPNITFEMLPQQMVGKHYKYIYICSVYVCNDWFHSHHTFLETLLMWCL